MASKDLKPIRICDESLGGCGRTMVSQWSWHNGLRRGAETYCHLDNGLCRACDQRLMRAARRAAGLPRPDRRRKVLFVPRNETEIILDDYDMIRDSVSHIREAAERIGITHSRLDKMLYRARKRNDPRGRPPLEQYERAIDRGAPYGRDHPRQDRTEAA